MSNRSGRELLAELERGNFIDYGKAIPSAVVRDCLELVYPDEAPKRVYDQLALAEMAAVDYVRNVLLGRGMYLKGEAAGYRILHISENVEQVTLYMNSADKKLRRGIKLLANSPRELGAYPDQMEARLEMKRENIRAHRSRHKPEQPSA